MPEWSLLASQNPAQPQKIVLQSFCLVPLPVEEKLCSFWSWHKDNRFLSFLSFPKKLCCHYWQSQPVLVISPVPGGRQEVEVCLKPVVVPEEKREHRAGDGGTSPQVFSWLPETAAQRLVEMEVNVAVLCGSLFRRFAQSWARSLQRCATCTEWPLLLLWCTCVSSPQSWITTYLEHSV